MVKISLYFWDSSLSFGLGWVMKGGKLCKTEYGEMTTGKSTFQRRICQLQETLVLSSEAKYDKNKHGDLLQEQQPKWNSYDDIKIKISFWLQK